VIDTTSQTLRRPPLYDLENVFLTSRASFREVTS
jgi:hypothetical protein